MIKQPYTYVHTEPNTGRTGTISVNVLANAVPVKATVPYIITHRNIAHLQGYNLAYGNGIRWMIMTLVCTPVVVLHCGITLCYWCGRGSSYGSKLVCEVSSTSRSNDKRSMTF